MIKRVPLHLNHEGALLHAIRILIENMSFAQCPCRIGASSYCVHQKSISCEVLSCWLQNLARPLGELSPKPTERVKAFIVCIRCYALRGNVWTCILFSPKQKIPIREDGKRKYCFICTSCYPTASFGVSSCMHSQRRCCSCKNASSGMAGVAVL